MPASVYDLAIVGGGINGAGIARDAAGRGLRVFLAEQEDLAGATSSASSKLIHGGLRYLEQWHFRLVRESLQEREVLLRIAPHIIHPLRFVLPYVPGMRSRGLIRLGLALYDRLAERHRIPASSMVDLARDPAGRALKPSLDSGFAYYDCWVDDARLVVLNARDAANRGAVIAPRTRVVGARRFEGLWSVELESDGRRRIVFARALVNAAGPWADQVAHLAPAERNASNAWKLRLVKGSHIVVPRISGAEDAYLMQSADGRVVFAIPIEGQFTMIGTTDVPISGDPRAAASSADEEAYLLELANRFFARSLKPEDIVWRFAGVRPLIDDGKSNASAISREYLLKLEGRDKEPPLLNVIGGKITTYRRLAEEVLEKLGPYFPEMRGQWTAGAVLPGGDVGEGGIEAYRLDLGRRRPDLDPALLTRLVRLYGTQADRLLGDAKTGADLGAALGGGLTEREVNYLKTNEWASTPEDVLWRRTKVGLHMTDDERARAADRIGALLARDGTVAQA
jgi:glycerol-3-phosphate dehydrogenase